MDRFGHILKSLQDYYDKASEEELTQDALETSKLGSTGVTWEEYLEGLNRATMFPYVAVGVCDDVAQEHVYNDLISPVEMGEGYISIRKGFLAKCSGCTSDLSEYAQILSFGSAA